MKNLCDFISVNKYYLVGLIILGGLAVIYFQAQKHKAAEDAQVEIYRTAILQDLTNARIDALMQIDDISFSGYVFANLDRQCPFYKPSGAAHRDCLRALVDKEEAAYRKASPTPKEIDNFCQSKIGNIGGTGVLPGELVMSCRAYWLQDSPKNRKPFGS